jgi:septum site-determining protein MinC
MEHTNQLTIKGTKNGLVINLPQDGEMKDLMLELEARLQATAAFFKGGRVALQVGQRDIDREGIERIGALLDNQGVSLWSVLSQSEVTRDAAKSWGLETESSEPRSRDSRAGEIRARASGPAENGGVGTGADALTASDAHPPQTPPALLLRRTLRSGQRIEYSGDITIIGDVNPGAEIIAGGNIVVWGKLRGAVFAGASGNESAVVCALSLFPTQLRIGSHIARSPEARPPRVRMPETASVQNGEIVAEPWPAN